MVQPTNTNRVAKDTRAAKHNRELNDKHHRPVWSGVDWYGPTLSDLALCDQHGMPHMVQVCVFLYLMVASTVRSNLTLKKLIAL